MKTFKVKPAEKFALEFTGGEKIEMCFNMKALSILGEQINNKKITFSGPEFFAAIIYSGAKACNPDFTEEEANALYIRLEESMPDALNGIVEEYCHAAGIDPEEIKKKAVMSLMQRP